jgi:hypothetical protein
MNNRSAFTSPTLAGRPLAFMIVLLAALPLAACKRGETAGAGAKEALAGCLETNPRAEVAAACMACLQKNTLGKPVDDGCCGIRDPVGLQLCQAVSACTRSSRCNLAGDTTTCFCGTHQADCDVAGKANGPCTAQIAAAAGRNLETGTTDRPEASEIMARYGETKYALGRASNIAAIAGAFCRTECGIGM